MATNKFPAQTELIERVQAILNLTNDALALEVAVRPETMQKYAAGYQKAGDKLMRIIARLPETRQGQGAERDQRSATATTAVASSPPADPPRDVKLDPPSTQEQLCSVLREGTLDEIRLLRQVVETLFRQVEHRREIVPPAPIPAPVSVSKPGRHLYIFDHRPRLLPALGYIPAGWPQETLSQQATQFVVVPENEFPEADYVLKVAGDSMVDAGIHHGDWVVMTTRREPRPGNVVAALLDNATTLKTYLVDERGQPYLRSENLAYPSSFLPSDELLVQGVMLGRLEGGVTVTDHPGQRNGHGANGSGRAPAPF